MKEFFSNSLIPGFREAESSSHIPQGSSSAARIDTCIFSIVHWDFSKLFLTSTVKIWSDIYNKQNSNMRELLLMCLDHKSSRNMEIKQSHRVIFHRGKEKRILLCSRIDNPSGSSFGDKKKSHWEKHLHIVLYIKYLYQGGFLWKRKRLILKEI